MSKKLYYFNAYGLGESIRYILHYAGEKFEDIQYNLKDWPIKEVKDSLPYGQMPLYEEDGRTLNQSIAIARYVAHKAKLLPEDPWEQAVLDAVVHNIYDFTAKLSAYFREQDPVKKEEKKKEILEESVEFFFSRFEKELKKNNGYFGGKLSWADFVLVAITENTNWFMDIKVEDKYPKVKELMEKIHKLPGVKEYRASRKPYGKLTDLKK